MTINFSNKKFFAVYPSRFGLLFSLLGLGLAPGAGFSDTIDPAFGISPAEEIRGQISQVESLAPTSIRVFNLNGHIIAELDHEVGPAGTFTIPVTGEMLDGIKVVVSGHEEHHYLPESLEAFVSPQEFHGIVRVDPHLKPSLEGSRAVFARKSLVAAAGSESFADSVLKNAVGWAGGDLSGWIMSRLGSNQEENKLGEVKTLLNRVTQQLTALETQLADSTRKISKEIDRNTYSNRAVSLNSVISDITAQHERMGWLIDFRSDLIKKYGISDTSNWLSKVEGEIKRLKEDIQASTLRNFYQIHYAMTGAQAQEGLIQLFDRVALPDRFVDASYFSVINQQIDYYKLIQTMALNLVVEVYHLEYSEDTRLAVNYSDKYKEMVAKWLPMPDKRLPKNVAEYQNIAAGPLSYDLNTGLLIAQYLHPFFGYLKDMEKLVASTSFSGMRVATDAEIAKIVGNNKPIEVFEKFMTPINSLDSIKNSKWRNYVVGSDRTNGSYMSYDVMTGNHVRVTREKTNYPNDDEYRALRVRSPSGN